jgi:hypothetical protein
MLEDKAIELAVMDEERMMELEVRTELDCSEEEFPLVWVPIYLGQVPKSW